MSRLRIASLITASAIAMPSAVSTGLHIDLGETSAEEFRLSVVRPVLRALGDSRCEMETLLVATAAHESHLGRLSKNVFQITEIAAIELRKAAGDRFDEQVDKWSVFTQVAAAAAAYRKTGETIPNSAREAASFWKRVYNTSAGKGTTRKFLRDAKREGVGWCE